MNSTAPASSPSHPSAYASTSDHDPAAAAAISLRGLRKSYGQVRALDGVDVLHAGTGGGDAPDAVVTAGGRVLAVVGRGQDLAEARARAYAGVEAIDFEGAQWRTDIALKAERGQIAVPGAGAAGTEKEGQA